MTKVKVVTGNPTTSRIPYYIAVSKGFMREEGLDVETESMSGGGADAVKVMGSGAVDFHVGQVVDDVNINKAGVHVIGVGMIVNRSSNGLAIRKDMVGKIKTMADARGPDVVIGVSGIGSGTWQFAVYNAMLAGLKQEDLQLVAVQPATTEAAFKAGRIHLSSAGDPIAFQMIKNGVAERFIDLSKDDVHERIIGKEYIDDQVSVAENLLKTKPALVQSFMNGIQRSLNWMNASSTEDIAAELRKTEGFDFEQDVLVGTLNRMRNAVPKTAVVSEDALNNTLKLPIATGGLDAPIPFSVLIDNQFAEKAAKALPPSK